MGDLLYFDYNDKSSVLLIAFSHALIFSFLLWKNGRNENKTHGSWLAFFVLLGGLYLCPFMFGYAGWYGRQSYREFLFFVPFQQLFLLGPVFFFYVRTLLNPNFEFQYKHLVHFVPAALYLLYSLVVFVIDKLILTEFYFYADGQDKDLDFWYQMAGLISMLCYLPASLKYYVKYSRVSQREVSYADEIAFRWIRHFIVAFSLILVLRLLFFVLNPEWGEFGRKYWYYLCFSMLLMYISISGYSNTIKTTLQLDADLLLEPEPENAPEGTSQPDPAEALELEKWKTEISRLFKTEKIYRQPDLTLTTLAGRLGTNRNIVSKVINQEFQLNFNDFVNEKRAEAVIERLRNGDHHQRTLLAIALDCGFNSKTTFNRAFKKYAGSTPQQFILKNQL